MAYLYYTDLNSGYIIRLDLETADQKVLYFYNPGLDPAIQGYNMGGTVALPDGTILLFIDSNGANQQALKLQPDLDPATAVLWTDTFAQVGNSGFAKCDLSTGFVDADGAIWLDWSYGAIQDSGPAYALTKWSADGVRLDATAECRAMYDAGGDGSAYIGNSHSNHNLGMSFYDGLIYRLRETGDALYRYAPDGSVWEACPLPTGWTDFYLGMVPGIGLISASSSAIHVYDPTTIPWQDVKASNGILNGWTTMSWGSPIATFDPYGGGPAAGATLTITSAQSGSVMFDGSTMIFGSGVPDFGTHAFALWQIDLNTGVVSHVIDVPFIYFRADGTITTSSDPDQVDSNSVLPMGMAMIVPDVPQPWIIGQVGDTHNVFYNSSQ